MKYLLEGPQAEVVLQENRNRIAMGMVKITPVADEAEEVPEKKAEPEVEDTKDVAPADEKKPAKKAKK